MHVWPEFLLLLQWFAQQASPACGFEHFETVNHFAKQLVLFETNLMKQFDSPITTQKPYQSHSNIMNHTQ